jgi:hypothetical protein
LEFLDYQKLFLINKKGKIIYKHLGPLDKKIIENDIYPLLN